jgi:phage tail-like protein
MSNDDRQDKEHLDESGKGVSRRAVIGAAGGLGLAAAALSAGFSRSAEAQSSEGAFFALEIPDFFTAVFPEARGIGSETLTDNGNHTKATGHTKWSDIELKRGVDTSSTLYDWRKMVEDGNVSGARKNGSIVLYNQAHSEVGRWNFVNAWPRKYESGGFDALRTAVETPPVAWEVVTLTVESLTRVR